MHADDVRVNFHSKEGISDYAAYQLGRSKASGALCRAEEVLQQGKLHGVEVDLGERQLSGKCSGSNGETYSVRVQLEVHDAGRSIFDWATCWCECGAATRDSVCKHALALLLGCRARIPAGQPRGASQQRQQHALAPAAAQQAPGMQGGSAAGAPGAPSRQAAVQEGLQPAAGPRTRILPLSLQRPPPAAAVK